jgi:hypothetical protein
MNQTLIESSIELLNNFQLCVNAMPKHNVIEIQLEKDACSKWASNLSNAMAWGTDNEIAEAYYQLEPRLKKLKEKVTLEILKNGSI